jgi:hypothetical protein
MSKSKKVAKIKAVDKIEFEKNLGECHDGEYYKLQMKDGSIRLVAKRFIDKAK